LQRSYRGIKTPATEGGFTVVIVEDDPSVLRSLRRLVRSAGFTVRTFASPGALLDSEIPKVDACLVVDVNLPEMNGVQLCEVLTASGRGLPAILITGQSDLATNRLVSQARAVAVLHKPFAAALLLDAISAALSKSASGAS
jgi:FixJ family two-component response regulator